MRDSISFKRALALHPAISGEVVAMIEEAERVIGESKCIRIVQGLRTFEEQQALYNQPHDGKDNNENGKIDEASEKVTNASAGQSMHNYGLAFDICFMQLDSKSKSYIYTESKAWLVDKKVVEIFKKAGFVWGGDFKSLYDAPHFEKSFGLKWQDLKRRYDAGNFIAGTKFVKV